MSEVIDLQCITSIEPRSRSPNKEAYLEGSRILLKLLGNVLDDPGNDKYRKIRSENKTIKEKLLRLDGCAELLRAIGFKAAGEEWVLTQDVSLQRLRLYRDKINERREAWLRGEVID